MKYKLLAFIPLTVIIAGCATSYGARDFFGRGYSEIRTNPDSFIVTFKGNGCTYSDDVMRYALLRASELTIQNGYSYFVVLSSEDQSSNYNYSNTHGNATGSANSYHSSNFANAQVFENSSSSTYSETIVRPGTSIRIKCFKNKPQGNEAIDARFYWEANKS